MEAIRNSETQANIYQSIRRSVPKCVSPEIQIFWPQDPISFIKSAIRQIEFIGINCSIAELNPRILRRFAWQPSVRVSQTLCPSFLSHVITAATSAEGYWHIHRSDCRITLMNAHKTPRTFPHCDNSLGSLTVPASTAGDFVKLILLYDSTHVSGDRCSTVVKVLCYKSEGRSFDPRWCYWNFPLT